MAVETNPWDRAISTYFWKTLEQAEPSTLREFVLSGEALTLPRNHDIYSIRGIPVTDRILEFSWPEQQLVELTEEFGPPSGINECTCRPRAKGQYRPERDYREYFDEETRRAIALQFAQEIEYMGYTF